MRGLAVDGASGRVRMPRAAVARLRSRNTCSRSPTAGANDETGTPTPTRCASSCAASASLDERHHRAEVVDARDGAEARRRRAPRRAAPGRASARATAVRCVRRARPRRRPRSRRRRGTPRCRPSPRARRGRGSRRARSCPRRRGGARVRAVDARAAGSRPDAGSSSSSTSGSCTSARARLSRCFCPRESTRVGRSASGARSTRSMSSAARCGCRIRASCRTCARSCASASRTVSDGHEPSASGIQPMRSRTALRLGDRVEPGDADAAGVGRQQRREHEQQRRLAGAVRPDQARRRVPGSTSKVALRTACTSPNDRATPSTVIPPTRASSLAAVGRV